MASLDTSYPNIVKQFGDFKMKGQTESQAFLAWFLRSYYRLEGSEVDDAVCDQRGDKGIDGIYVNEMTKEIDVLQARLFTVHSGKALGDTCLKELRGTLDFFKTEESVNHLAETTDSENLRKLIIGESIGAYVRQGFKPRGVFVTNKKRDRHATDFLAITPDVVLYDEVELQARYLPIGKADPIATPITFTISDSEILHHKIHGGPDMYIAPILASELVKMDGIANQELFAWNLRYRLQRSAVNKEIDKSIATPTEHKYFPAYHNGLTVLAEKVTLSKDKHTLKISGYSVVNGCQSLSTLHTRSADITDELKILTKVILISPKNALAAKITDHTNRQNGVSGRDLASNNEVQMRLQNEVHTKYKGEIHYRIARGEHPEWEGSRVVENTEMGRILMAFDLKTPESCHQQYKLFDPKLHGELFARPAVDAHRIVALADIDAVIRKELTAMNDRSFAAYSLTPYLFLYLLRDTLEEKECEGAEFVQDPSKYLGAANGRARLRKSIAPTITVLVNVVAAELKRRADLGTPFDYKKDLKSKAAIKDMRSKVVPQYQTARNLGYVQSFQKQWEASSKPIRKRNR